MSVHSLFPIPLGIYNIGRELTFNELNYFDSLDSIQNIGNKTSINNRVLNSDKLFSINSFIKNKLEEFTEEVFCPQVNVSLKITQSWVNFSNLNNFHHQHIHLNSFISGVFYVKADRELDSIVFYKQTQSSIYLEPKTHNDWNLPSLNVSVGTGDLIFFPSYLHHGVGKIDTDRKRISLSFNTFPEGKIGSELGLCLLSVNSLE